MTTFDEDCADDTDATGPGPWTGLGDIATRVGARRGPSRALTRVEAATRTPATWRLRLATRLGRNQFQSPPVAANVQEQAGRCGCPRAADSSPAVCVRPAQRRAV